MRRGTKVLRVARHETVEVHLSTFCRITHEESQHLHGVAEGESFLIQGLLYGGQGAECLGLGVAPVGRRIFRSVRIRRGRAGAALEDQSCAGRHLYRVRNRKRAAVWQRIAHDVSRLRGHRH